ncbi:MAG TPA: DUF1653 domain-containing protein [Flavipsychrobacter sp.]|nr:DUF1653 domain-containing protein [Flavipsychrobacter sp.]
MQITTGFYYHYKHDPEGEINNYAYEVLGVGYHTEKEEASPDKYVVVYRALYEAGSYVDGKMFAIRPYDMFTEQVEVKGVSIPRFGLITDVKVVNELKKIRDEMYSETV